DPRRLPRRGRLLGVRTGLPAAVPLRVLPGRAALAGELGLRGIGPAADTAVSAGVPLQACRGRRAGARLSAACLVAVPRRRTGHAGGRNAPLGRAVPDAD